MDRERLYARLDSPKCMTAVFRCVKNSKPLTSRSKRSLSLKHEHRNGDVPEDYWILVQQVEQLHEAYLRMASMSHKDVDDGLEQVLLQAFVITRDGISLERRLQDLGFTIQTIGCREVRQISMLGNYVRISHTLVQMSRSYHTAFTKLELQYQAPFTAVALPRTSEKIGRAHV